MTTKIKVGLVGYGLAGMVFHAPLLTNIEGFELTKVVTTNQVAKARADLPGVSVVAQAEDLWADSDLDLVVIASPNLTHYPLAQAALQAGKHVVVDKPFTNTSQEAHQLIELASATGRVLSVFQSRRWDGDFLTIKECFASGLLGDISTYVSHYDRYRPEVKVRWREEDLAGSGILYDLGAHLIDQALHLFGPPRAVTADLQRQRPGSKTVDYFHLLLDYGNLRVILHSGSIVKQPGPRFQIHGSRGSFIKYGLDQQEDALKRGQRPGPANPDWGREGPEWWGELTTSLGRLEISRAKVETLPGAYQDYYRQLLTALTDNGPLPVQPADAARTIEVIEAAMTSSRENRTIYFEDREGSVNGSRSV